MLKRQRKKDIEFTLKEIHILYFDMPGPEVPTRHISLDGFDTGTPSRSLGDRYTCQMSLVPNKVLIRLPYSGLVLHPHILSIPASGALPFWLQSFVSCFPEHSWGQYNHYLLL